jgi:ATP-dependent protease HslVU (ClpYQ) ATPase subunit
MVLISKPVVLRAKGRFPMPTQEERLTILEYDLKQYKTETIKAYGEMAVEMTMVKGLTEDAVKRLASLKAQIEQRFEHVDMRLDAMDAHFEGMNTRLDRVENLLVQILARLPEKP